MAEEIVGQGAAEATQTNTAPETTQQSSQAAPETVQQSPAQSTPEYQDVLDYARSRGMDTGEYKDGNAYLDHLFLSRQQLQQANQMAQYGQQVMPYWSQFQQFLAQQQAAQQQQTPKQSWWKAPEYNQEWVNALEKDPTTGEVKVKAGHSPDILQKYLAATDHQRTFLNKFAFDPVGSIKPGIEELVKELVQPLIQQHLGGYQDTQFANNFVKENSNWLHQRDQSGQIVLDPMSRQPALSEWGRLFAAYVNQMDQLGIKDVRAQQQLALDKVQRDYYAHQLKVQNAQQTNEQQKANFIAQPSQPNVSGATQGANGQTPQMAGNHSLKEMLKNRFQQQGIN